VNPAFDAGSSTLLALGYDETKHVIPQPEQRALGLRAAAGDPEAIETAILSIAPLLVQIVNQAVGVWRFAGEDLEDFYQIAFTQAAESIRRYDASTDLGTFLGQSVRLKMRRHRRTATFRGVHCPPHVASQDWRRLLRPTASLATPIGHGHSATVVELADTLPAPAAEETPDDGEAEAAVADLARRDAKILRLRYGLGGQPPLTIGELAKEMNVTRERARQLESNALRAASARHGASS
jgi:RNA polymerase sigma factor (sigma-70 family)